MTREEMKELYQACKWEAIHFAAECGMNTSELWSMVHGKFKGYEKHAAWWLETVLDDYRNQRI